MIYQHVLLFFYFNMYENVTLATTDVKQRGIVKKQLKNIKKLKNEKMKQLYFKQKE